VTPGESRYVPKEVTDVLDIGPRLLSGDTVVELLLKSDCEELLEEEKIKKYHEEKRKEIEKADEEVRSNG